jgi:hypothetical protein
MLSVVAREMGEHRFWVCDHANTRTCHDLIAAHVPAGSTWLYTDAWQSYRGSHLSHVTVRHGVHEGARDDDGAGQREVHGNSCEGAGAGLRTFLRVFRAVQKASLHRYRAIYEAMVNAKQVTPALIQRMGIGDPSVHTGST